MVLFVIFSFIQSIFTLPFLSADIREFDDERAGELLIHTEATEEVACEKPKRKAKVKDGK